MAVIEIWDVKDDLRRVWDYASIQEKSKTKTEEGLTEDLNTVISYTF